jgi:hypothetical protein
VCDRCGVRWEDSLAEDRPRLRSIPLSSTPWANLRARQSWWTDCCRGCGEMGLQRRPPDGDVTRFTPRALAGNSFGPVTVMLLLPALIERGFIGLRGGRGAF